MNFRELLELVGDEPVFETGLLLSGDVSPGYIRRQLSGWVNNGSIIQLRRGLYALAPPYRKIEPHTFLVANKLVSGSYVSLQTALAYYDLIPEIVPITTSITTGRPSEFETLLGRYTYRHIKSELFFGFRSTQMTDHQQAYVASPDKALLDLIYLEPEGETVEFVEALRLQNLDRIDFDSFKRMAIRVMKPKLHRALTTLAQVAVLEEGYDVL